MQIWYSGPRRAQSSYVFSKSCRCDSYIRYRRKGHPFHVSQQWRVGILFRIFPKSQFAACFCNVIIKLYSVIGRLNKLINKDEFFRLNLQPGLFQKFSLKAIFQAFSEFKSTSGRHPNQLIAYRRVKFYQKNGVILYHEPAHPNPYLVPIVF